MLASRCASWRSMQALFEAHDKAGLSLLKLLQDVAQLDEAALLAEAIGDRFDKGIKAARAAATLPPAAPSRRKRA